MSKFALFCLNHSVTPILLLEKPTRLGPPISDAPFSRVEASADYQKGKIHIKNLGVTKCIINYQKILRHGEEALAVPGDLVDLTFGTFVYQIRAWSGPLPAKEPPKPEATPHKTGKGVVKQRDSNDSSEAEKQPQTTPPTQSQPQPTSPSASSAPPENEDSNTKMSDLNQSVLGSMLSPMDVGMFSDDASVLVMSNSAKLSSGDSRKKKIKDSDWRIVEGLLGSMPVLVYGEKVLKYKPKVAGFDLDFTIIKPGPGLDSSNLDVTTEHLWEFLYPSTPKVIKDFFAANSDHKLVIVTNKAKAGWLDFSKRIIEEVVVELNIPAIVFAAKEGTEFLKPAPFIWRLYNLFNEEVEPDWGSSFFCGDCAGRVKDVSKGDRLFALNAGMGFKTPEGFFLSVVEDPALLLMPKFIPKEYVNSDLVARNNDHISFPNKTEVIVMCGIVASGKSRYVSTTLEPKGYVVIKPSPHLATLKDRLDAMTQAVKKNMSVVVDRRNVDTEERSGYIRLAQSHKLPIRCFHTNVSEEHSRHNMRFQEIKTGRQLNTGEMEVCLKRHHILYEEPTTGKEGFTEVVQLNFIPQNFMGTADLDIYSTFLIQR